MCPLIIISRLKINYDYSKAKILSEFEHIHYEVVMNTNPDRELESYVNKTVDYQFIDIGVLTVLMISL